jgi:Tfp pilus assembly protein PilN
MNKQNKKKVIDLREFSAEALTEEKKILKEGLFKAFLAGVVGYLLGKRKNNLIIKGQRDQIDTLTKYLTQMKNSSADKDQLISKLQTLSASTQNIRDLKRQFKDQTGISLP